MRAPVVIFGLGLVAAAASGGFVAVASHHAPDSPTVQAAAQIGVARTPTTGTATASTSTATVTATATTTATATVTVTHAPPAPATDLVRGKISWTMFLGSDLASDESGDTGPACGAGEGAVTIMNSTGTILTVHQSRPVVLKNKTDRTGDVTTSCEEDYAVRVPSSPVYRVTLTNPPNNDNATTTCKSTLTRTDSTANVHHGVAHMQELGWFFGCY